jgi:heme-degrading monooxygenase HmoA
MDIINSRADDFKSLRGLQQKYYLQDETSGEFGGLYLWESKEDFTEYRESELRATIGKAYQTESEPRVEVMQVIKTLR